MILSEDKLKKIEKKYNNIKNTSKKYRKQMNKVAEEENWHDYKIPFSNISPTLKNINILKGEDCD